MFAIYVGAFIALGVGFTFGLGFARLHPPRTRHRRSHSATVKFRDIEERARFAAFRDMWTNYRNEYEEHVLTAQDYEHVMQITFGLVRGYLGNRSMIYEMAGLDQNEVSEELAVQAVEQASGLFLSI